MSTSTSTIYQESYGQPEFMEKLAEIRGEFQFMSKHMPLQVKLQVSIGDQLLGTKWPESFEIKASYQSNQPEFDHQFKMILSLFVNDHCVYQVGEFVQNWAAALIHLRRFWSTVIRSGINSYLQPSLPSAPES